MKAADSESKVVARLVVNPGTDAAWEIQLQPGVNTIGRSEENQFSIEHESVSSSHCQLSVLASKVVLQDLGSVSGTFVDGELVETAVLRSSQRLRLGEVEMLFDAQGLAEAASPAKPKPVVRMVTMPLAARSASVSADASPSGLRKGGVGLSRSPSHAPLSKPSSPRAARASASAPISIGSVAVSRQHCKVHPRVRARFLCPKCGGAFCDFCVNFREGDEAGQKYCRACGEPCAALPEPQLVSVGSRASYASQIGRAFAFPCVGDGLILLIGGTIFYSLMGAVLGIAKYAFIFGLMAIMIVETFGTGYLVNFLKRIVTGTAAGEERMPDWPEFTDVGSDILSPMFQLVGTMLGCFLPALLVLIFMEAESAWRGWVLSAALLYGCFCFPMAFLAVAMFDSILAVNPVLVVPSIFRVLREYLLAVILFAVVLGLQWAQQTLATAIPAILASVVANFAGLYLLTVEMRVLGLLYRAHSLRLGWFPQRG
jgi:hypothetical protein